MAASNEALGQERGELLPRPVVHRRHAPRDRSEDGDAERLRRCDSGDDEGYSADGRVAWAAHPLGRAASFGLDGRNGNVALFRLDVSTEHGFKELVLPDTIFQPAPGRGAAGTRRYGILGSFPPTECGIATFTAALAAGLEANGAEVGIVRVGASAASRDTRVVELLEAGSATSTSRAVRALDAHDVAIVQHEYGLYGGVDGDEVVELVQSLDVPSIVVAHTVLLHPSPHQREVLEAVAAAASAIVVMTDAGRDRLCTTYDVDADKVVMIPHGAAIARPCEPSSRMTRPTILTWGLLGEGKGIEWAIDAMRLLRDLRPRPRYVIAGDTHPKVFAREGDRYREMLVRRAWEQGVVPLVTFDRGYRDLPALSALIDRATVVLLPYDSQDQVTSGVLVDAVAAGRPVVSTAFPHATELLASGAGIVVPQRDPAAIAAALRCVLTQDGVATAMAAEAARLAPELGWNAVAGRYHALAEPLVHVHAEAFA